MKTPVAGAASAPGGQDLGFAKPSDLTEQSVLLQVKTMLELAQGAYRSGRPALKLRRQLLPSRLLSFIHPVLLWLGGREATPSSPRGPIGPGRGLPCHRRLRSRGLISCCRV